MKEQSYKLDYIFLLLALSFVMASFYIDFTTCTNSLFSRSGSIMVLVSVIVEYRISNSIYAEIQKAMFLGTKINLSIPFKAKPSKDKVFISRFSHTLVILGTVIWGYGDLLFKQGT